MHPGVTTALPRTSSVADCGVDVRARRTEPSLEPRGLSSSLSLCTIDPMSLRLRQAIPGQPSVRSSHGLTTLSVDGKPYIAYISASNVVLLDHELELTSTLPFWSALPHRAASSSKQEVEGVIANKLDGLIIAWSGVHAVLWHSVKLKGISEWKPHSTLVISAPITCLDYKSGILAIGTRNGIELWKHNPQSAIVVWDRVWERQLPSPSSVAISPASGHIACFSKSERCVRVLTINAQGQLSGMPQEMRHPRELQWIGWRKPRSSTGDAHLYTITSNSVLRIYAPVLDDPAWFQLHSTLDERAFVRTGSEGAKGSKGKTTVATESKGRIWPLEADIVREALERALSEGEGNGPQEGVRKTMETLLGEETDVVFWVGDDGALSVRSILNMDRKPPTLLKSVSLAQTFLPQGALSAPNRSPPHLMLLPGSASLLAIYPPTDIAPHIQSIPISLSSILAGHAAAVSPTPASAPDDSRPVQLHSDIRSLVRTPNGRGLLAVSDSGEIGVWGKLQRGTPKRSVKQLNTLVGRGRWMTEPSAPPDICAIFAKGRAIVTFSHPPDAPRITLQHLDPDATSPTPAVSLPDFHIPPGETIKMVMAVSDIDDGRSGAGRRTERAFIMAVSGSGEAWVWSVISRRDVSEDESSSKGIPDIRLLSRYTLPVEAGGNPGRPPILVLPVDPMGWHQSIVDWKTDTPLQDMVLTISEAGVLEFWRPRLCHHIAQGHGRISDVSRNGETSKEAAWIRSGVVHTSISNITMARCSSRKKTVLVRVGHRGEQEMTIWDSNVSEFSTGLELSKIYGKDEVIQDLDWTTTSDLQSVLAVGFPHKVELVCEQRMSYVDDTPGWATFVTIDLTQYTTVPINDSIWLAGGSLAVGCGNQLYLFSRFIDRQSPPSTLQNSKGEAHDGVDDVEDIFQLIAHQNGPLLDYHPTVLAQCLLWNKLDLVKEVLVSLRRSLQTCEEEGSKRLVFERLDPMSFSTRATSALRTGKKLAPKYESLFDTAPDLSSNDDDGGGFNQSTITELIERLESNTVYIPLSSNELSMLATLAQATVEVERQRRSLDICGLRYLISIRMFVNCNRLQGRISGTATPASSGSARPVARLSFRNIVWATHSESDDVLLAAATECCEGGKMIWADAKRLGVFLWMKSAEASKSQLEILARNRFMMDEDRDPTCCSLIFFALGKKKVVHGLWRQAPGHKEQNLMLKFLANDFELERWKVAATKNAYALLSRQRYEYAAAFFMLAGSPKDAITIVLRQLDDWQLAFALARVVENGTEGPMVKWILSDTVIPLAFAGGHRWLATWAFWTLGRRDLAVRVLISPMSDVALDWSEGKSIPVGNPENDDPSLLLLFQYLKSRSLQTAKGTSEIKGKTEFDFVLHNARVFCRMGCHPLALDLIRSWSFERPFFPLVRPRTRSRLLSSAPTLSDASRIASPSPKPVRPSLESASPSFTRTRRPSFMLSAHGRRESMVMDMDVMTVEESASVAPTRPTSPIKAGLGGVFEDEESESAYKLNGQAGQMEKMEEKKKEEVQEPRKMGNLMKELKQDVQQGAMEFNMDNFF